jgi:hypothetical protein
MESAVLRRERLRDRSVFASAWSITITIAITITITNPLPTDHVFNPEPCPLTTAHRSPTTDHVFNPEP